ncbi:MAG TPA: Gfo/Idh/MocA family oxidoreductase, partial [Candidatus Elarobacter sp.]
ATGRVALCGVVARTAEHARAFGAELGGVPAFGDLDALAAAAPQAVLLEVPHAAQDELARRIVAQGLHVLIGAPLATTTDAGIALDAAARARGVVVEAGFEARYKPVWETAKTLLASGALGRLVAVDAVALWDGDPASWYYDERASAGMPLTHMTYCFVNPLRWLLGEPLDVAAVANSVVHAGGAYVREETCTALLRFPGDVPVSLVAGYVRSADHDSWRVTLRGTSATLELLPAELGAGALRVMRAGAVEERAFAPGDDGFTAQAHAFLDTIAGADACRNRPRDCIGDLRVADAIVRAARERVTVALSAGPT